MDLEDKTELTDVAEIHCLKLDELPKKPVREMTPVEQGIKQGMRSDR